MAWSAGKLWPGSLRFCACFYKESTTWKSKNILQAISTIDRSVRDYFLDACSFFRKIFVSVKDQSAVCGSISGQDYATQGNQFISLVLLRSKSSIPLFCFSQSLMYTNHASRVNWWLVRSFNAFLEPSGGRLFSHASLASKKRRVLEHTEIITQELPFRNTSIRLPDAEKEVPQKAVECLKHSGRGMPTISRLEQSNVRLHIGQIAQVLIEEKNEDGARGFLKWAYGQRSVEFDSSGHCAIIKLLAGKNMLDSMVFLLKEMPRKGLTIPEDAITTAVSSYAKTKRVGEALELFLEMETYGWEGSAANYNYLSRLLCRAGLLNEADYLIKHMEEKGWNPDVHTFLAHVHGLGKARKLDAAFEVFQQMLQKGLRPDVPTYSSFLRLCCKVDVGLFFKFYNQMKAMEVYPNEYTYADLIKGFVKSRKVDEAHVLLKEMIAMQKSPPASLSAHMIITLIRCGKSPAAYDLLEELIHKNFLPDSLAFRNFTYHLSRAALIKSTWDSLKGLRASSKQLDVNTYDMLVHSFAKSLKKGFGGEVTKAVISKGGSSLLLTFNVLIDCLCKADQVEPLLKFYLYMKTVGMDPNEFTYSCVINILSESGRVEDAYNVFQDMCCKRVTANKEICMYLLDRLVSTGNNDAVQTIEGFVNQQFS